MQALSSGPQIVMFDTDCSETEKFRAKNLLTEMDFPLNPKWKEKEPEIDPNEDKNDPNAINEKLAQLIRHVHGSLDPKAKLIEDFLEQHVECSRNSVEKKLKELFVKEKREQDLRARYYVTEAAFTTVTVFEGGVDCPELVQLAKDRLQPMLDEMAAEAAKEAALKAEA